MFILSNMREIDLLLRRADYKAISMEGRLHAHEKSRMALQDDLHNSALMIEWLTQVLMIPEVYVQRLWLDFIVSLGIAQLDIDNLKEVIKEILPMPNK